MNKNNHHEKTLLFVSRRAWKQMRKICKSEWTFNKCTVNEKWRVQSVEKRTCGRYTNARASVLEPGETQRKVFGDYHVIREQNGDVEFKGDFEVDGFHRRAAEEAREHHVDGDRQIVDDVTVGYFDELNFRNCSVEKSRMKILVAHKKLAVFKKEFFTKQQLV